MTIELNLESPKHGWVSVRLDIDDRVIAFAGSDVLNNPVQEIVEALPGAAKGDVATVWWWLEPDGYYFEFLPNGDQLEPRVLFSPNSDKAKREVVATARASRTEVILAVWRGLRQFESYGATEPHWPPVDYRGSEALRESLEVES